MPARMQRRSPGWLSVLPMPIRRPEGRVRSKPPIWTAGYDRGLVGSLRLYRLDVHHSLEGEHVHALRSRERGCFLVVQDSMGGKNSVNNRCRIAKHFGRNEIEVALISSALLRIACLVTLHKT